jgi:choline-sulfatase
LYQDVNLPDPYDCDPDKNLKHPVLDQMRDFWDYADYFDRDSEKIGLRNYYALCSFLDDNVGQVLTALNNSGQAENTQIIYTSDHGDMTGNHGIWGKCYMYEDSVGIPMVMSGPGIESSINNTPVSLTDLAATIEYAVHDDIIEVENCWQSRPLQKFIEKPDSERPVLSEYHDGGSPCGLFMLRKGCWKYVYFSEGHPALLFDMDKDPWELHNLASETGYAEILAELNNQLRQILDPEEVNRLAFADQAKMVDRLGGMEAILALPSFNHTPVGSG